MTVNGMMKIFEQMTEEERNLPVKFFNPKYEEYDAVKEISFSTYNGKFVLLNEA